MIERDQPVEAPEKRGQGSAAPGRRVRQQMPARGDLPSGQGLDAGRPAQALGEPAGEQRMNLFEHIVHVRLLRAGVS